MLSVRGPETPGHTPQLGLLTALEEVDRRDLAALGCKDGRKAAWFLCLPIFPQLLGQSSPAVPGGARAESASETGLPPGLASAAFSVSTHNWRYFDTLSCFQCR